ncbi:periplasmic heavy metal sensor [Xinfangfangia sp. D13-10-4-6]|uniref:periplasmic heavy metal sensor n=1 Tax=Pseudogemmobacter hezensis TaxID=2737662 RepID=UPI0015554CAD|nr:periplasmic heavy metal sensor [Pseudogemmobacter hezensis]NPD15690.1 periplasmic heavy metal sensor [Pseudogemmobacter hezensis]
MAGNDKMDSPSDTGAATAAAVVRTRGWVRALLVVSLALNLAIGGLWAGIWLGHEGGGGRRDNGLGPLATAMRGEDWRAMREAWVSRQPEMKRGHQQLREDYDPLLAALRAEPFDPAAMQTALATISLHNSRRLTSASDVIGAYLATLNDKERLAYAHRLEEALRPPPKRKD